ncbi:MAG: M81 family metallopeptidase [Actinomyces urogenitalis]|uniref:Microcystin degradation protein MlrC n=1 Tax=Actinomyces urogenitalis TaxID=103621 RepID=A0A2I1KV90_9ACTO|nr:M81 family metallopeptidase [Actinomyces urogenitalis]MDU0971471.1 M81 family metallopeptidase [Actinomyces urogenitalis]PKY99544.1 microcystin degradation protein MlrC [Actinomyces urogenitalis]
MGHSRPRIAICGLHIESSTFTPYTSGEKDFVVRRGQQLLERYSWKDEPWAQAVDWVPVLHAGALPGGVVERRAYEAWREEIEQGLRQAHQSEPLDGVFFDIHGAASVEGEDDAEGDLVTAVRRAVGPGPMISASMDLHGNVSDTLFDGCDLMTCYRMAPHEDARESVRRAAYNLVARLRDGSGKPVKALVHVPVLLPGEKTSTRIEPARSLYARVPDVEARPGVTDAAIWIGFAWADQPRCQGAVVVYGDDRQAVADGACELAEAFWQVRDDFDFVAPVDSLEGCLEWALTARRPTFISDSGDNPGAGGADDVTVALAGLLAWEPVRTGSLEVIHASIVDPVAAEACWQAGAGGEVSVELGGHIDTREPGPVPVTGTVTALCDDPMGGRTAALRSGGLTVIVTSRRNQYAEHEQYARLGLDVRRADVVVVKIGYLEPDLYEAQRDWKMALTPGGVDQDLIRLGHRHIERPMVPFDTDLGEAGPHLRLVVP